jgi:hypothetical protein
MLAGFRRLSISIMWYVEVMVRGIFIQRPILRDVVVAGVGCVYCTYTVSHGQRVGDIRLQGRSKLEDRKKMGR